MKLRFSPAATREVAAAFSWYERAQAGLGYRFKATLQEESDAGESDEGARGAWDRYRIPITSGVMGSPMFVTTGPTMIKSQQRVI